MSNETLEAQSAKNSNAASKKLSSIQKEAIQKKVITDAEINLKHRKAKLLKEIKPIVAKAHKAGHYLYNSFTHQWLLPNEVETKYHQGMALSPQSWVQVAQNGRVPVVQNTSTITQKYLDASTRMVAVLEQWHLLNDNFDIVDNLETILQAAMENDIMDDADIRTNITTVIIELKNITEKIKGISPILQYSLIAIVPVADDFENTEYYGSQIIQQQYNTIEHH